MLKNNSLILLFLPQKAKKKACLNFKQFYVTHYLF